MDLARGDGTDIPAVVRGNENGRREGSRCEDIHDQIKPLRQDSDNPAAVLMDKPSGDFYARRYLLIINIYIYLNL
jgi:hypothetical protein